MLNLVLICVIGIINPEIFTQEVSLNNYTKEDTLQLISFGINNKVVIDSISIEFSDSIPPALNGEILQSGKNNSIKINKHNSIQQQVIIRQTGKNNKVKINSQ